MRCYSFDFTIKNEDNLSGKVMHWTRSSCEIDIEKLARQVSSIIKDTFNYNIEKVSDFILEIDTVNNILVGTIVLIRDCITNIIIKSYDNINGKELVMSYV